VLERGAKFPGKSAMGDDDDADHLNSWILCGTPSRRCTTL
jgi:hypothetical protein